MLIAEWPNSNPVKRPLPLIRPPAAKYTMENCLPPNIQFFTQQQYVPPYTQQYPVCSSGPQYLVCAAGTMQPYITYASCPAGQQYSSQQYSTYVCAPGQQLQYANAAVYPYSYTTGQQQQGYSSDQTACDQAPTPAAVYASQTRSPKPLVSKLGACGRKIADAVKHVGHHNKHQRGGVPERSTA